MLTRRLSLIGVLLLLSLLTLARPVPLQAQASLDLERIQRATVYVMQVQTTSSRSFVTCVGTGTIVERTGFIITNAHNTVPNSDCMGDDLIIALSDNPDEPPVPTYRAEVAQADVGLDLALLRITRELSGRLIDRSTLSLPFVQLADSATVRLDDTITVVGYAGLGNESVGVFRGTISGFVAEPSAGERAWFKTDATIPGTATGGGVYNQRGQLVAIPSTVPVVSLAADATCVPIEDTNGDGLVNSSDVCVPVGGFINALRPSNFVRPLLRGATLGLSVDKLTGDAFQLTTGGTPDFSRLFVSPGVTEGMPTTVAPSLPTATNRLYLFFDYRNMTPETIYELRVTIQDIPNPTYSLAPVRWSGGRDGLWYIGIGSEGQVLPNGVYEFTLSIDGLAAATYSIVVGSAPQNAPTFRNITFGIEDGDNLYGTVYVLPAGNVVSARFIHQNVPDGLPWVAVWYFNDEIIPESQSTGNWVNDGSGTAITRLQAGAGLPAGRYRLELYMQLDSATRLAATADFTIAGASEGAFSRVFSETRLTTADSPIEAANAPSISNYPSDVPVIYALFNWEQLAAGTLWRVRWLVDDEVFYDEVVPWTNTNDGQNFTMRLTGLDGIPDGSYRLELYINSVLMNTPNFEAEVGIGQLPIDRFAQTVGVQLNGRIVDAETREGLPGISFVLITEDYSVADFVWDQNQVYAIGVTDRDGRFQIDRLLQFGDPYSLVIVADGYLPIERDGIIVDEDTPNPVEVVVNLLRDR